MIMLFHKSCYVPPSITITQQHYSCSAPILLCSSNDTAVMPLQNKRQWALIHKLTFSPFFNFTIQIAFATVAYPFLACQFLHWYMFLLIWWSAPVVHYPKSKFPWVHVVELICFLLWIKNLNHNRFKYTLCWSVTSCTQSNFDCSHVSCIATVSGCCSTEFPIPTQI